jgi:sulfur carrier protein
MRVTINQTPHNLPDGSTLADAVALLKPSGPYAAAINLQFVPKSQHGATPLADGDQIEIIAPVTGG